MPGDRRIRFEIYEQENGPYRTISNKKKKREVYDMLMIYDLKTRLMEKVKDRFLNLIRREDGMGVVEIILITIVLISMVIIFKSQISGLVNTILGRMSSKANTV